LYYFWPGHRYCFCSALGNAFMNRNNKEQTIAVL
ncbi:MAG: hypothetical protein ACI9FY_001571, partial [Patiriisocius sp.]